MKARGAREGRGGVWMEGRRAEQGRVRGGAQSFGSPTAWRPLQAPRLCPASSKYPVHRAPDQGHCQVRTFVFGLWAGLGHGASS